MMMIIGCLFFGCSKISERFEAFEHFLSILICHKHPHINMPLQTIVDYFLSEKKSSLHQEHLSKLQTTMAAPWKMFLSNDKVSSSHMLQLVVGMVLQSASRPMVYIPWVPALLTFWLTRLFGVFLGNRQDSRYSSLFAIWLVLAFIFFYDFETTNRSFSSPCFSRI